VNSLWTEVSFTIYCLLALTARWHVAFSGSHCGTVCRYAARQQTLTEHFETTSLLSSLESWLIITNVIAVAFLWLTYWNRYLFTGGMFVMWLAQIINEQIYIPADRSASRLSRRHNALQLTVPVITTLASKYRTDWLLTSSECIQPGDVIVEVRFLRHSPLFKL